MAYPDKTTPRSYGGSVPPAYITSDIPAYYTPNQTITMSSLAGWYEVSDTGQATTTPLGDRGPFVIAVSFGKSNEEKILCSDADINNGFITVWTDGVLNGRGYDGTIISTHRRQTTQIKTADTYHVSTAVESLQFNEGIIAALVGGQGGQGAQGVQGAQGSAGSQGAQGDSGTGTQGPQGDNGSQGQGFTYQGAYSDTRTYAPYDVVTGSDGSTYITPSIGDLPDPTTPGQTDWTLFTSVGAQGPQGDSGTGGGSQGPQGYQGADGAQGSQGDQGPQGNDGSQGYQGNDGSQGFQGDFGPQGNDGSQGPQGNDGAQGFQGNDGPQGNDGAQGAQGTAGASFPTYLAVINSPDGIATDGSFVEQTATFTITGGPDAYVSPNRVTLIVSGGSCSYTGYISDVIPGVGTTTFQVYLDGYTGTNSGDQINWYMSLSGIQGVQGVQGNDGSQGAQGNDGNQGAQGNDGAQGAQGYQGQADKYATYSAAYTNIPTTFPFTDNISVSGGLAYSAGQGIVIAIDGADYAVAVVNAYDAVTGILNFTIASSTDVHGSPFQGFSWGYAVNLDGAVGAQGTQGYQGDQGPQGNDGSQGPQGNDGAQGSQGDFGPQGNDGAQGTQGDQGQAALWNFSGPYNPGLIYTTGDVVTYEGQTWYRLIYGASGRTPGENIWWTLVAAEGSQGPQGAQGAGTQGAQGAQGTGAQGNDGAQGPQGFTGDPGIYESADSIPPTNVDILWLDEVAPAAVGPQGTQGVQGVQGARGYQGSVGAQGANGSNGSNGNQGSQGTQGYQGATGYQGSQGNNGPQGFQGAGVQGATGSQGPQGFQGAQGATGTGTQGTQGSQGNQGTAGSYTTSDSGWIAVSSFTNSFVVGVAVAYRKLNGIVYLRGSVQSGTPANAAFTLPTGYRPSETSVFAIQQYGLTTNNYITINTDGTVVPQTASAWLNNVVYPIG